MKISWLRDRPIWLQTATIKLMDKDSLDNLDIDELVELCINEANGNPDIVKPKISGNIIIPSPTHSVKLCSIGEIHGINALEPRKPLDFGEGNLTIVYGDNASGKSGYVRILKHACGARVPGILYGNVYRSEHVPQKCRICYKLNNSEVIPCDWVASCGRVLELQSVNIYDIHCGKVYVEGKPEVGYEPPELLLFDKLIEVCDKVSAKIDENIEKNSRAYHSTLPAQYTTTSYGLWYSTISLLTTNMEIDEKTRWTENDEKRATELQHRLAEKDPAERARQIRIHKTNLDLLINDIKNFLNNLSNEPCIVVFKLKKDADEKDIVAKATANEVFRKAPLKGIGSEIWKLFWEKAREYSEKQAYKDKIFPFTDENARCVLCQQVLSEEARERMISFEDYIKGEMQKAAESAKKSFEDAIIDIGEIQSTENLRQRLTASGIIEENDVTSIETLFEALHERKKQIIEIDSIDKFTPLPDTSELLKRLGESSTQYESSAIQFESDAEKDNRPEIEQEFTELQAQKWVSEQKKQIIEEIKRHKRLNVLKKTEKLTNTISISKEKSTLSEKLITEAFIVRFNNELIQLGASNIKVELEKVGVTKGKIFHRIRLKNTVTEKIQEVLSEGEQRIVSLAAFLADVTGKPNKSSFVFDDPVSSLDHTFEEAVAKRLVDLSKDRQVIVFTHRLNLLGLIEDYGGKNGCETQVICVRKESWGTGEPGDISLMGQKPVGALKTLINQEIPRIRKIYENEGGNEYEYAAKYLCSEVRILLERIIEHDLLADVVKRHRRAINTQGKIEKLAYITGDDCHFLDAMMSTYSIYEHSQSDESPVSLPDPDQLQEDMIKLKNWHDNFLKRQKGAKEEIHYKPTQGGKDLPKPLIVQLVGRAAAQSDGRCIDLEESNSVSIKLIAERAVLVTGDTLDPVVRPGQYVLLAPEENGFNNGDLVAVDAENQKLLRRIWRQDNNNILLESINPIKTTFARKIDQEKIHIWKATGVLYEPRGNEYTFGVNEWDFDSINILRNINKMNAIIVEGNSIDPIARKGQYVLINESISLDCAKDGMLAIIETIENGRVIKRINLQEGDESIILTSTNLIDPHEPISIDTERVKSIYPLVGVLFEATIIENQM